MDALFLVGTIGNFDRHTYRVIIDNHVLPFIYYIYDGSNGFVLQEDNCGPHRACSFAMYLQNEEVTRMHWLAQSPDLNPIENIWGLLKSRQRKRHLHPSSPNHLFSILNEIWNSLPDDYLNNLVVSMPKRVRIVRTGKGRSTKY